MLAVLVCLLTGKYPVKVSSLETHEKQARDIIRVLSHAEIFSYASFKSLHQENMDVKVLSQLLESTSIGIKDAMSIACVQALELQQLRREAAISSASRSLTEDSKQRLRAVPLNSKLLFGGQLDTIYKENTELNTSNLVNSAVVHLANVQYFIFFLSKAKG